MRSSDWSSDVCSSDLEETRPIMLELFAERFSRGRNRANLKKVRRQLLALAAIMPDLLDNAAAIAKSGHVPVQIDPASFEKLADIRRARQPVKGPVARSEEHTSELQSLMSISYAVFSLKQKNTANNTNHRRSKS